MGNVLEPQGTSAPCVLYFSGRALRTPPPAHTHAYTGELLALVILRSCACTLVVAAAFWTNFSLFFRGPRSQAFYRALLYPCGVAGCSGLSQRAWRALPQQHHTHLRSRTVAGAVAVAAAGAAYSSLEWLPGHVPASSSSLQHGTAQYEEGTLHTEAAPKRHHTTSACCTHIHVRSTSFRAITYAQCSSSNRTQLVESASCSVCLFSIFLNDTYGPLAVSAVRPDCAHYIQYFILLASSASAPSPSIAASPHLHLDLTLAVIFLTTNPVVTAPPSHHQNPQ